MYFSHIGEGKHIFPLFPHSMQEGVAVAAGEDRFVVMVTDSVALFALWDMFALWLTPYQATSHLGCKPQS